MVIILLIDDVGMCWSAFLLIENAMAGQVDEDRLPGAALERQRGGRAQHGRGGKNGGKGGFERYAHEAMIHGNMTN